MILKPSHLAAVAMAAVLHLSNTAGAAPFFLGLGDLSGVGNHSGGRDISDDGSVATGFGSSPSGFEAFRWTSGGGLAGLGDLAGGGFLSQGTGISNDGTVVAGGAAGAGGPEAFRWTQSSGMVGLGELAGGDDFSAGYSLSGDGGTVVGLSRSGNGDEAFRWTQAGGMVGLGDLAGGSFQSDANAVNADGTVVVGSSRSTLSGAGGSEAFRWTQASDMVALGDLAGGAFSSVATGVSADGSVIIGFGQGASGTESFIWDSINGVRSIQTVLTDLGLGASLIGWSLTDAYGISSDGRYLAGEGNHGGNAEAWIAFLGTPANVPEPATLALFVLGLLGLGVARRRRRAAYISSVSQCLAR